MTRRGGGALLIALGAIVLAVSALADPIGVGEGGGLGWKQTTGVLVGAALMGVGGFLVLRRSSE